MKPNLIDASTSTSFEHDHTRQTFPSVQNTELDQINDIKNASEAAAQCSGGEGSEPVAADSIGLSNSRLLKSPIPFSTKALETRRPRAFTENNNPRYSSLNKSTPPTPTEGEPIVPETATPEPPLKSRLGVYLRRFTSPGNRPEVRTISEEEGKMEEVTPTEIILPNSASIRARSEQVPRGPAYQQALQTLMDMFENVDKEVCEVVLQSNNGHLPPSIEALLEISKSEEGGGGGGDEEVKTC